MGQEQEQKRAAALLSEVLEILQKSGALNVLFGPSAEIQSATLAAVEVIVRGIRSAQRREREHIAVWLSLREAGTLSEANLLMDLASQIRGSRPGGPTS